MTRYSENNMLKIAKRFNNKKRTYLLVNPLQAKHLASSPTKSLEMMHFFGKNLAYKYPNTKLIIGFAETATAIGAAIASCFSEDCVYMHTTREKDQTVTEWIRFEEEHSHAVEQLLCADNLSKWIEATKTVLFVEDEISTGKTLINIIECLKRLYPVLNEKELVVASLLNRVSNENEQHLLKIGLKCEYLVKLPENDYEEVVRNIKVVEAERANPCEREYSYKKIEGLGIELRMLNKGMKICEFINDCNMLTETLLQKINLDTKKINEILVLGTEECMYPALYLGKSLEERGFSVVCHATTRSPIGLNDGADYPIRTGKKLNSFYESNRDTYIYDLRKYDFVIVVSDTKKEGLKAMNDLVSIFGSLGCKNFCFLQGGQNVWYI